jgi:hypothetical protein
MGQGAAANHQGSQQEEKQEEKDEQEEGQEEEQERQERQEGQEGQEIDWEDAMLRVPETLMPEIGLEEGWVLTY